MESFQSRESSHKVQQQKLNTQTQVHQQREDDENYIKQEEQEDDEEYQQDSPSMEFQLRLQQNQPNMFQNEYHPEQENSTQKQKTTCKKETNQSKKLFQQFADDCRQQKTENYTLTQTKQVHFELHQIKHTEQCNSDNTNNENSIERKLHLGRSQTATQNEKSQQNRFSVDGPSKEVKPFVSMSQLQSENKLYEEYQHDDNISSSEESESSIDSEASFAKMNARRTMLLSDDFYGTNQYSTIINQLSSEQCKIVHECAKKIAHLQSLIKRESILLEFQQKTKNERIKQIEYSYINAFNNFLCLRNVNHRQSNPILLNEKDLYQIHDEFLDDLRRIKEALGKVIFDDEKNEEVQFKKSIASSRYFNSMIHAANFNIKSLLSNELQPPQSFLIDFNNFFPCWSQNIHHFMEMEFESHQKIENTFQSEYTIASKILSSIRHKDNIRRFCQIIFRKPLQELKKVKTELIVDFANIYEKWSNNLFNIPNSNPLKQFMQGKYVLEQGTGRNAITQEISKFFGEKMDPSEYEKLLIELNHFSKNRNAMNFLFNQIGKQEIEGEQINLRLALLVYKKMQINRRKLQQLSLLFINQIIDNYADIPVEIKYVVQVFRELSIKKLEESGQQPVIKFEDLKSFFNKIIFSQLFFTTFMELLQSNNSESNTQSNRYSTTYQSHNITMIALIAQKIMFGQQFYEKFKYGYFNTVIKEYAPKIKDFIENFARSDVIKFEKRKQIECMLISLQTLKFLYESLRKRDMIKQLVSFEKRVMKIKANEPFSLGSSKYTQQKMYIMVAYKPEFNYSSIFKPKEKFRRTFIEFLTMIESINDGVTFREVLEQYKCMQEDNLQQSKPSIQIYANYLASFQRNIQNENIVEQIQQAIHKTKLYIEKVKISLERQHNISTNLEHLYQTMLRSKKKLISQEMLQDYINLLYNLPLEFDYYVVDGKICENENTSSKRKERIIKDCLNDVSQFFGKGLEGLDGLYSLLLQKIVQEVSKQGVIDENMIESAQSIIGKKLYKTINLANIQTEKDRKLFSSMRKHRFLNLKMLTLPQYIDQEQIILQLSLQILQRLKHPMSPDKMIECFHQVTLVFQNVITCVGKASDITSDVQIPLMELILVKSMIPNLNTMLEFIKTFSHNDSGSNKFGMILALVESICYLIENMDAQHLGISEAEYVGYIENQYMIID